MGRLNKEVQDAMYRSMAELIYNKSSEVTDENGKISPTKVRKKLLEDYGFDLSFQATSRILKKNLKPYLEKRPSSDENIKNLEAALRAARRIIDDPDTRPTARNGAMNAYANLMKTKLAWEKQIMELKIRQAEQKRPIHKVVFGHFKSVESKCPKCGHKYYDVPGQKEEKNDKKWNLKAGEGQSQLKGVE